MPDEITGKVKINQLTEFVNKQVTGDDVFPFYYKPSDSDPESGTYQLKVSQLRGAILGGGGDGTGVPASLIVGELPIEHGGTGSSTKIFLNNTTDTFDGQLNIVNSSSNNNIGVNATAAVSSQLQIASAQATGSLFVTNNIIGLSDRTNNQRILAKDVVEAGNVLGAATTFYGTATSAMVANTAGSATSATIAISAETAGTATSATVANSATSLLDILPIDKGGTGKTTSSEAFTALSGYTLDCNTANSTDTWVPVFKNDIIQHRVIPTCYNTSPLAIANGGTGATTRIQALKNLLSEHVASPNSVFALTNNHANCGWTSLQQLRNSLGLGNTLGALPIANGGTGNTTGNAASATKLATARTIQTNLASTGTASFNGTNDIKPGVTGILQVANGGTGKNVPFATNAYNLAPGSTKSFSMAGGKLINFIARFNTGSAGLASLTIPCFITSTGDWFQIADDANWVKFRLRLTSTNTYTIDNLTASNSNCRLTHVNIIY